MLLVFWDIDGTLLTTGRAGIHAWEDALAEVSGVRADLDAFDTAGHPDHGIARRLLREIAGEPEPDRERTQRLVERYETHLPGALPRRRGRVLANVREILDRLAARDGVRSLLLTGNTRRGAAAKLAHYGLDGYFAGGAFSDDAEDRDGIARAALAWARAEDGGAGTAGILVVGDTPHDVRCGKAIGAATLAVATGGYDLAALGACTPTHVVAELPAPDGFLDLLATVRGPAAPAMPRSP